MGMGVTDTIVAGRASALDLSGLAVGNALSMPFYFLAPNSWATMGVTANKQPPRRK